MADKRDFWTQKRADGKWEVKREGNTRATSVHERQSEAWNESKDRARDAGGEAYLKGRDGLIRERNTYGKDPYPPKG